MAAFSSIQIPSQQHSIPLDIRKELPDHWTPWKISPEVFAKMSKEKGKYKKAEVLPTDPEWRFIWRHFYHDKPRRWGIGRIYCIHERHQQQAFELGLSSIEREAEQFKPTWNKEPRAAQRAQAIERWKEATQVFSPFSTLESDGRRRNWKKAKVLPLWHGTSKETAHSIAETGFVYFGKTSLENTSSDPRNTDKGFFGSGIYFSNSAGYVSDIYSSGHVLMAWVSMREPFPVVGDINQKDMDTLKGQGAYKDYNAHYVPVNSLNPSDPYECMYYPSKEGESPHCDEIVVFHKSQALPRFWVELTVESPTILSPSNIPQFVNELIPHLFKILEHPSVDRDQKVRNYLGKELAFLLKLPGDDYLEDHGGSKYETLYGYMNQLIVEGKVDRQISRLMTSVAATEAISKETSKSDSSWSWLLSGAASLVGGGSSSPQMAFGKNKWGKYFGDVGIEPPLPPNISEILQSPCPFWRGKKVEETHMLVLIPKSVNGEAFTIGSLGKMIKNPSIWGHKAKYYYEYGNLSERKDERDCKTVEELKDKEHAHSYWALITKHPIPTGDYKTYSEQEGLIKPPYSTPKALELATAVLMHHVQTGQQLFLGYGWCQETIFFGYGSFHVLVDGNPKWNGLSIKCAHRYLGDSEHRHRVIPCRRIE